MAKVRFNPQKNTKSKRHITLADCDEGDIVYLETAQIFGLIIDTDIDEKRVADLTDGDCDWYPIEMPCRRFSSEINFDVNDFEEFI